MTARGGSSDVLLAPVSAGEVVDKITILRIKQERISDPDKLKNIGNELRALEEAFGAYAASPPAQLEVLTQQLQAVNEELWVIEDDIRDCERAQDFGPRFIELARAVYHTNDRRAQLKRQVNEALGSTLVEEKSYADYSSAQA